MLLALLSLGPSRIRAQALQSFEELPLRVNLDDRLRIEDSSGARTTGRLSRLTRDELAIQTDAGEKRFTSDDVYIVAIRGHSLRKGALIGTGVVAVLGALATCSHEEDENCIVVGALRAAPIGAGVGLAIAALASRMKTIYRAPESRAFVTESAVTGASHASLLEDLGLRVNLDDQLRVEDRTGLTTTGRLTRLTADEITLHTNTGDRQFTRETVRRIAIRYHSLRAPVLIGAGAGAAIGAVAACTGSSRDECADAPILTGAVGAGLGLAAGALIRRTTMVYPQADNRALVVPVISRRAVGLRVSRRW